MLKIMEGSKLCMHSADSPLPTIKADEEWSIPWPALAATGPWGGGADVLLKQRSSL